MMSGMVEPGKKNYRIVIGEGTPAPITFTGRLTEDIVREATEFDNLEAFGDIFTILRTDKEDEKNHVVHRLPQLKPDDVTFILEGDV